MGGYTDRVSRKKKVVNRIYRCGGRKKAELGTDAGSKWTKQDTGDLITGLSSGIQMVSAPLLVILLILLLNLILVMQRLCKIIN